MIEEDEADREWERAVAREWATDLEDCRQDLYTLADGESGAPSDQADGDGDENKNAES